MNFLRIEKLFFGKYRLKFVGKTIELSNYINVMVYDQCVHFNIITKQWEIYEEDLPNFINNYKHLIESVIHERPKILRYDKALDEIGLTMKLKPYMYQREAIKFALDKQNALIILPCGSGKSPIGVGLCVEAYKQGLITGKCLIVVKASLKYQWSKEIEKFSDLKANIIDTPSKAGKKKFEKQFEDCDVFIANYETLKNEKVMERLKKEEIELIYSDEIHYVNNYDSARSKALAEFNYVKYKVGATATPITNNPSNLFGIFNFIDKELFTDWKTFSKNFLRYTGYKRPPKPKNEGKLREMIAPYMLVKSKEDIGDQLPSIVVTPRYINMSSKIADMNDTIMFELDEESKRAESLEQKLKPHELEFNEDFLACKAKIMALQTFAQEIVDSPRLLIDSDSEMAKRYYVDEESPKLNVCMELVDEIISSGEKVCIFTKYERMQTILEKEINKNFKGIKIAKINGTLDATDRYVEAYDKFRDNDEYKVLLGTDAMAEGVNLSKCKYLIEYDLANSHAIQTQRHGRLERADSIHSTVYAYQLIMENSWDTIQQRIVEKKENYDSELIKSLAKEAS
jgi:SNF2 family DNA or RNA helicase|nr:MAG TPA: Chromatin remodeling complex ATPase [Caudoviricetes sp.]